MFLYLRLLGHQYVFFFCCCFLLFACQQKNNLAEKNEVCNEPNFENYTFCVHEATQAEKAWEAKTIGLMQQIHLFFDAIKCNDIPRADLYASKYGLGTLLYLNVTFIDFYEVLNYEIYGKTAIVRIKFNKEKAATSCVFKQKNEQPNTWFFHGIDTYEIFSRTGTKSRYGHKVKLETSLP